MLQNGWQRFLRFLLPERTLDADDLAALRQEDHALNLSRFYTWSGPMCVCQILVLWSSAQFSVHTAAEVLWRRNLLALGVLNWFVYFTGFAAPRLKRWIWPALPFDKIALALYLMTFIIHSAMGVNAQLGSNSVLPYLFVVVAAPHIMRVPMAWLVKVVLCTAVPLMVGVYLVQRLPLIRQNNILNVWIFSAVGIAFASAHRQFVVDNFKMRRALQRFNVELESRVESQTLELRRFARRLDEVLETERRRLARELHDDLGQELTALRLELASIHPAVTDPEALASMRRMGHSISRALLSVRAILESLRPRMLDEEGLETAVSWLALQLPDRVGCKVEVDVVLYDEPPPEVGLVAFRVVQEALTNVARHAQAKTVMVSLHTSEHMLRIEVADDGVHRREGGIAPGRGLAGMRERVLSLGGTLELGPREPQGTRVLATLPLQAVAAG